MPLPRKAIEELKKIYKDAYGKDLSTMTPGRWDIDYFGSSTSSRSRLMRVRKKMT